MPIKIKLYIPWLALAATLLALVPVTALEELAPYAGKTVVRVDLTGNRFTRDFVIRRQLKTRAGQPFRLDDLHQDLVRLENLDLFSSVKVKAQPLTDGVALTLYLREIPPVVPYLTYDVTDEDGWSYGPAVKAVNLFGRDLYAAGFALFGGKDIFQLDLNDPWIAGDHLSLDLDIARIVRDNQLDGFRETSFEFSPWVDTYVGQRGRAGIGLAYFRVESDVAGHTLDPDSSDDLFSIGARLGYDSRDVWASPHRGWLNQIEVVKTGGNLPGEGDYWTTHADLRRFQPLRPGHTLVLGSLLSLQSGRPGIDIPEYMDFHLGGSNTIRGHNIDNLGRTLKGKNQYIGAVEYRLRVMDYREVVILGLPGDLGLDAAFFADWGLAWDDSDEFERRRGRWGWGIGLRLLMPAVDMVRFDLGFDKFGGPRLHFASFSKLQGSRWRLR
jgi:outer membrane protein assembly factor BamA